MQIQTNQFGLIRYDEDKILHFQSGIFGFENLHSYIIIDDEETQPFRWLQSTEEAEVCFPLLDPFLFFKNYISHLPKDIVRSFKDESKLINVLVVVTLKNDQGNMTMNLKGPLILNFKENSGEQIVLNSEKITTSHILN
jgi:flagellar assembly factor FliW